MGAEDKLHELDIELPPASEPLATYRTVVRAGNLVHLSGSGPILDGKPTIQGRLGDGVSLDEGYDAARLTCLNLLATLRKALGSLDDVKQVVRMMVYVASADGFEKQPAVANGATDLLKDLFGEAGLPARAAVGVNVLPMGIPVEIEMTVETRS